MTFCCIQDSAMFCLCAQNSEATSEAVDTSGWFDTGDLGWIAPYWKTGSARSCGGVIVLDGRAKDTIVLLNGLWNITNLSDPTFPCSTQLYLHVSRQGKIKRAITKSTIVHLLVKLCLAI